ncbi:MAG: hypothetical protein LBN24_05145 [Mediterranea sp.]|jgi:hypothetical protein|nr:hypothetical protein [Mediterranea sp.]
MKTNKKAILGMLVAMVMSLGIMGGMNTKNNDANLQQATVVMTYQIGTGRYTGQEGGVMAVGTAILGGVTKSLGECAVGLGWCPAGWIAGVGCAIAGL